MESSRKRKISSRAVSHNNPGNINYDQMFNSVLQNPEFKLSQQQNHYQPNQWNGIPSLQIDHSFKPVSNQNQIKNENNRQNRQVFSVDQVPNSVSSTTNQTQINSSQFVRPLPVVQGQNVSSMFQNNNNTAAYVSQPQQVQHVIPVDQNSKFMFQPINNKVRIIQNNNHNKNNNDTPMPSISNSSSSNPPLNFHHPPTITQVNQPLIPSGNSCFTPISVPNNNQYSNLQYLPLLNLVSASSVSHVSSHSVSNNQLLNKQINLNVNLNQNQQNIGPDAIISIINNNNNIKKKFTSNKKSSQKSKPIIPEHLAVLTKSDNLPLKRSDVSEVIFENVKTEEKDKENIKKIVLPPILLALGD